MQAVIQRAAEVRHQAGAWGAALHSGLHARHLGRAAALRSSIRRGAALRRVPADARRPGPPRTGRAASRLAGPWPRRVRRRAALAGRQPRAGGTALGRLHARPPGAGGLGRPRSQVRRLPACGPGCGLSLRRGRLEERAHPRPGGPGSRRSLARKMAHNGGWHGGGQLSPAERLPRSCAPLAGKKRAPFTASCSPASCSWRGRHRLLPAQRCAQGWLVCVLQLLRHAFTGTVCAPE